MKADAEKKTEVSNSQENIPSFQLIDSPSSSDEKSPVISRTKAVDLNSTLDTESSQKIELESKEVESEEVTNEEKIAEEQNEDITEGPQLGENKESETNDDDQDQIKENVDTMENVDAKESAETEDTIEDIKNEASKLMDENENSNDGTPLRKKQKVEEQKLEDRQIDENSSDEEPEEVNRFLC